MKKVLAVALVLLACGLCVGQSSFKGLTPGKSTRIDVERTLGKSIKALSPTLVEYRPQPLTGQIFVQYRSNSPVAERIQFFCRTENSTCDDFIKSLKLNLPEEPDSAKTPLSANARYTYYFGPPRYVAATIDDEGTASLAFYSRELYEAEVARSEDYNKAETAKFEEGRKKPLAPEPGQITGIVMLNGSPVAGATIDLYRTDGLSGRFQGKTDRHGVFIFYGVFGGSYVAVASGPGMKWTYVNGLRMPVTAALEINAQAGDGARPTQEQVMAAIR